MFRGVALSISNAIRWISCHLSQCMYVTSFPFSQLIKSGHFTGCQREEQQLWPHCGLILHLTEPRRYFTPPAADPHPPVGIGLISTPSPSSWTKQQRLLGVIRHSNRGGMALVRLLRRTYKHTVGHGAERGETPGGRGATCLCVCM